MDIIKSELLRTLIKDLAGGRIFSVDFTKKDGSDRTMTCRLDVTKGTVGGELKFDVKEKMLLPVFDMKSNGFRMVDLTTVTEIRANGQVYKLGE